MDVSYPAEARKAEQESEQRKKQKGQNSNFRGKILPYFLTLTF